MQKKNYLANVYWKRPPHFPRTSGTWKVERRGRRPRLRNLRPGLLGVSREQSTVKGLHSKHGI